MKTLWIVVLVLGLFVMAPNTFAQGKMLLGGQVSLALPTGDFGDVATTGYGINGEFLYQLQPKLWLTGHIGYQTFSVKGSQTAYTDWSLSTIPIVAGIRYEVGKGKFVPYVGAELGFHFLTSKFEWSTPFGTQTSTSSDEQLGLAPLVGFMMPLSPTMILDVNLKYVIILTDVTNTTFIAVHGGLLFPI